MLQDQFLTAEQCDHFLDIIAQFKQKNESPEIYRKVRGRSLRYSVIDGEKIEQHLPEIAHLYQKVNEFVRDVSNKELVPLDNKKVGINVNITPRGGEYRWHYDRNAVTVLLYLNEVRGGELELYPCYRIYLKNQRLLFLQRWLDRIIQIGAIRHFFGKKVVVQPTQGRMVMMQGTRCLHSVRPVEGDRERINCVFSYDTPDAKFLVEKNLDRYLYTQEALTSDPNYVASTDSSQAS